MILWTLIFSMAFAGNTKSVSTVYSELRDLHVFVRLPVETCQADQKLIAGLGGAVESQQSNLLASLGKTKLKSADQNFLKQKSASCISECSCEALNAMMKALPKKSKLETLIAQTEKQAQGMTDKDYASCQKNKKVDCSRKEIQEALKQAQESAD